MERLTESRRWLRKSKHTDENQQLIDKLAYYEDLEEQGRLRDKLYRIITEINYSTGTCLTTDNAPRVDLSTICQCTGLKDENDKLIYENDIIRCKVGTAKVIWNKSEWRIEWLKNGLWRKDLYYWAVEDIQRIVVIGNIFDNKELLESEEK